MDPESLSVTARPHDRLVACLAASGGDPSSGNDLSGLPESIDSVFRLRVESSDGGAREAVVRFPVWLNAIPAVRNASPRILSVQAGGEAPAADGSWPVVVAGQAVPLRVVVDPASAETYTDDSGAERTEDILVSWYATAGRFADDRTEGLDSANTWTLREQDAGVTEVRFWMVARDLRGGQTVAGPYRIPVER